jgi:hypothetical protein
MAIMTFLKDCSPSSRGIGGNGHYGSHVFPADTQTGITTVTMKMVLISATRAVRAALVRCSKLPSAHVTSEVVGSNPGQTGSSCDTEGDTLTV